MARKLHAPLPPHRPGTYTSSVPGRGTPPLFEYLRTRGTTAPTRPLPPLPQLKTAEPAAASPEPLQPAPGGGTIRVSVYALYVGITAVLALGVLVWALGFQMGKKRGTDAALRELGLAKPPTMREPDPLGIHQPEVNGSAQSPTSDSDRPAPTIVPQGSTPRFIAAAGALDTDPRVAESNYLKLASKLSLTEADRVVQFLASKDVQALAVRVEAGGRAANDSPLYDLYSLFAVPSGRYSAMEREREAHKSLVGRLGQEWQTKHRGTVNFARPVWEKYP